VRGRDRWRARRYVRVRPRVDRRTAVRVITKKQIHVELTHDECIAAMKYAAIAQARKTGLVRGDEECEVTWDVRPEGVVDELRATVVLTLPPVADPSDSELSKRIRAIQSEPDRDSDGY
jgi:hypothetical protein